MKVQIVTLSALCNQNNLLRSSRPVHLSDHHALATHYAKRNVHPTFSPRSISFVITFFPILNNSTDSGRNAMSAVDFEYSMFLSEILLLSSFSIRELLFPFLRLRPSRHICGMRLLPSYYCGHLGHICGQSQFHTFGIIHCTVHQAEATQAHTWVTLSSLTVCYRLSGIFRLHSHLLPHSMDHIKVFNGKFHSNTFTVIDMSSYQDTMGAPEFWRKGPCGCLDERILYWVNTWVTSSRRTQWKPLTPTSLCIRGSSPLTASFQYLADQKKINSSQSSLILTYKSSHWLCS